MCLNRVFLSCLLINITIQKYTIVISFHYLTKRVKKSERVIKKRLKRSKDHWYNESKGCRSLSTRSVSMYPRDWERRRKDIEGHKALPSSFKDACCVESFSVDNVPHPSSSVLFRFEHSTVCLPLPTWPDFRPSTKDVSLYSIFIFS